MLFPALSPAAVAAGPDLSDMATVDGVALSRSALSGAITATAERVGGLGRVAVEATPTMRTLVAVAGALAAGVTAVPVPPDSGPAERTHILRDSQARAWLGDTPNDASGLPHLPVPLYAQSWHHHPVPPAGAAALILYTSGTTGSPKGVVSTHGAIAAGIDALASAWSWTADDTLVHGLPMFHVHGLVLGALGPLRIGGRMIHTGRPTPQAYAEAAGSMYFGVPTVWSRIAAEPEHARALSTARLLISGSAPLPPSVFHAIAELTGHAPVERYGMTETLITLSTRPDGDRRAGWVGRPLDGVHTRLRDEAGADLPRDGESVGELHVRGPMLGAEYLNRPDATAESWLADGWFATGDAAVIGPDDMHRIVGRMSTDLIKTGGFRVGAGEVEAALLTHPGVAEVAVVGRPDDDLGERIVAFVVAADLPGSSDLADVDALVEHVAVQISAHKRPREVRFVDALPRNALGKVRKRDLPS